MNWREVKLGDIVDRMTNGSSLDQYEIQKEGMLPITRIETIAFEEINFDRVKYVKANKDELEKYGLLHGDILFSHINSDKHLGKTAIHKTYEKIIHGINLLLIRTNAECDSFFLNYYFKYYRGLGKFVEIAQRAVNQSSINQKKLKEIKVLLPPLPEQKRIVAKLDNLFAHLDQLKARLQNIPTLLKQFRQAVLSQAVTGKLTEKWRRINNIPYSFQLINFETIILNGPQNGMYKSQSFYGRGNYILRIDNFYDGRINRWDSLKRLQVDKNELELYSLENNDIIINRVNSMSYLGKSAIVKHLPESCVFESNMMRIKLITEKADPDYIILFLNSQHGLTELRKNAKQAVNQASINQQDVKAVQVCMPETLEEQKEIVRRVESLFAVADRIEASYTTLQEKIDHLPQAILSKAFRGELVSGFVEIEEEIHSIAADTADALKRSQPLILDV